MRRTLIALLAVFLMAAVLGGPAMAKKKKKPKPRTATGAYQAPAIGALGLGVCSPGTIGCFDFASTTGEYFVDVTVADAASPMVFASVGQDTDGDDNVDTSTDICGSGEDIPIQPGFGVTVFIWEGPGLTAAGPCPGASTSGEIEVTFTVD